MNEKNRSIPSPVKTSGELLDLYYLDMRSGILEAAAAFDRVQRAPGGETMAEDRRIPLLREACRIAADDEPDRAERILRLFSEETS
ncbi:MAG: hypothetical protein PHP44_08300 [Kiritimatiellae bacterium]|nr:hypothetical protein [Kiritimatiellia bacterium]MDD4736092.1 hypothetical protein [Kiritimatiellia bacterium]